MYSSENGVNTKVKNIRKKDRDVSTEQLQVLYEALSNFTDIMRWEENENLSSWTERLLKHLTVYLNAVQSVIYTADLHGSHLEFAGGFAVDSTEHIKRKIPIGHGLLGQAAKSQEKFMFEDSQRFKATNSKGFLNVAGVLIVPLVYNYITRGVLEVAFARTPTPEALQAIDALSETIAANLNALIKEKELKQSLITIQEGQERLKRFSAVLSEGIIFLDSSNNITEANDAFLRIFNYSLDEAIGKNAMGFLADKNLSFGDLVLKTEEGIMHRTKVHAENGCSIHIEISAKKAYFKGEISNIMLVRDVTKQVETEINLRNSEARLAEAQAVVELSKIIEQKNNNIVASINYAHRIQTAMLPNINNLSALLPNSFIFFNPRDIVSGDFYWFSSLSDSKNKKHKNKLQQKIVVAVVDCTGHGVPGAFMSLLGANLLNEIVNQTGIIQSDIVLNELHKGIRRTLKQDETRSNDGMDIALCVYDKEMHTLEYAGAKSPIFYVQNETPYSIKGDIRPIGGEQRETERLFTRHQIPLIDASGNRIPTSFYLFSDGYQDQFSGATNKKFGSKKFREFLYSQYKLPVSEQLTNIREMFKDWKGNSPQIDDVLVIGVEL